MEEEGRKMGREQQAHWLALEQGHTVLRRDDIFKTGIVNLHPLVFSVTRRSRSDGSESLSHSLTPS